MSLDTLIKRTPSRLVSDSVATGRKTSANGDANDLSGQSISAVLGSGLIAKLSATGGTTSTSGGYKYHYFSSSGTLTIIAGGGIIEVAAVAGGLGHAGGSAYQSQKINVKYGRNVKVVVGASGSGGHSYVTVVNNTTAAGSNSDVYNESTRYAFSFSDARSISINGHAQNYGAGVNTSNPPCYSPYGSNCQAAGGGPGAVGDGGGHPWGGGGNGGAGLTLVGGWETSFPYNPVGGGGGGGSYGENNCDCGSCGGAGSGAAGCGGNDWAGSERGCNIAGSSPYGIGCGGGAYANGSYPTGGAVSIRYLA